MIKEEFEGRVETFWGEIDGIIDLLNQTDPKHTNTTIQSPQVSLFLLWRQLKELNPGSQDAEKNTLLFWNDVDGIINFLNQTDPRNTNTNIESPQISHFFMWRILNELKLIKQREPFIAKRE